MDHFFGVVSATDWAQHYFWRYHDEDHVLFDPEAGNRDALARIWERVDETVGIVADYARTEDATLLLVSDHGFGPVNRTFHVSEWLEQTGFSSPVDQSVSEQLRTKYFPYVRRIGEAVVRLVPPLNTFARSVGESIRKPPSEIVDFERSTAFAPKQSLTCGMVYLLSDDPADKQQVTDELNALAENDDRIDAIEIHDPADIYTGPKAALAPDLMVEVDNFECAVDPRPTTDGAIVSEGPSSEPRSGGHNQEGVIVAAGPDIDAGGDLDASIYDVAPTVLSLHGTAIPEGVDGTVIEEIVAAGGDPSRRPIAELTEFGETTQRDDDEAVQDRLEDLGYI